LSSGPNELNLRQGDIIEVVEQRDNGWWLGRDLSGAFGLFPANYSVAVEVDTEVPECMIEAWRARLNVIAAQDKHFVYAICDWNDA
jgi:hypothetical protein